MPLSWLGQARSAILRISRGVLRGARAFWREIVHAWWEPYPLITTGQKPEIVTRGENLGAVNLQMETLVGSVYDAGAGLVGPIGDPATPWQPAMLEEFQFTWQGQRADGDPFYREERIMMPLDSTLAELRNTAEAAMNEMRGKYPGMKITQVSTFMLIYGA